MPLRRFVHIMARVHAGKTARGTRSCTGRGGRTPHSSVQDASRAEPNQRSYQPWRGAASGAVRVTRDGRAPRPTGTLLVYELSIRSDHPGRCNRCLSPPARGAAACTTARIPRRDRRPTVSRLSLLLAFRLASQTHESSWRMQLMHPHQPSTIALAKHGGPAYRRGVRHEPPDT